VLTATGLVNAEWQILTPYKIETLEPIDKKFGTRDYVVETTPYAKFGANRSTGGFWANRWNITLLTFLFIYTFLSETHLQVRPLNGFWRAMAQKTRSHARMCLLGVKNVEINNEPLFMPPKRQILAKKVDLENFRPKTLYNGDAQE